MQKENHITYDLINNLIKSKNYFKALEEIDKYLNKNSRDIRILSQGAFVSMQISNYVSSINYLNRILRFDSNNVDALVNLSTILYKLDKFEESRDIILNLPDQNIKSPSTLSQCGINCQRLGMLTESKKYIEACIKLSGKKKELLYRLAFPYLALGIFPDAWILFENRIGQIPLNSVRQIPSIIKNESIRWTGQNLNKKTLMIVFEQGFGDFIQFLPYVIELKQIYKFSSLIIVCKQELISLLESIPEINKIFSDNDDLKEITFDYWVLVMSLPLVFSKLGHMFKGKIPYIKAINILLTRETLRNGKKKAVGLVWKGNPNHSNDKFRSIKTLNDIKEIFELKEFSFHSLQIQPDKAELKKFNINDLSHYINDFRDTSDLISQLDLIISVDTAIVHLAGAMNIDCWLMLSKVNTDWRWLSKNKTYCYESLTFFKQKKFNDWRHVSQNLKLNLLKFADL